MLLFLYKHVYSLHGHGHNKCCVCTTVIVSITWCALLHGLVLCSCHDQLGDTPAAEALVRQAVQLATRALGELHPTRLVLVLTLVVLLVRLKRWAGNP